MSAVVAPKTGSSTTSFDDLFNLGSSAPEAPIDKQTISDILLNEKSQAPSSWKNLLYSVKLCSFQMKSLNDRHFAPQATMKTPVR